jgi:hypothetical protein
MEHTGIRSKPGRLPLIGNGLEIGIHGSQDFPMKLEVEPDGHTSNLAVCEIATLLIVRRKWNVLLVLPSSTRHNGSAGGRPNPFSKIDEGVMPFGPRFSKPRMLL